MIDDNRTMTLKRAEQASEGLNRAINGLRAVWRATYASTEDHEAARTALRHTITIAREVRQQLDKDQLTGEPIWSTVVARTIIAEGTVEEVPRV
jgi:hypothetical protein